LFKKPKSESKVLKGLIVETRVYTHDSKNIFVDRKKGILQYLLKALKSVEGF